MMSDVEKLALAATYDVRAPYAYTPLGPPDKHGRRRFRGPALTGKVRCPNTPRSMRLKATSRRPTTSCPRGTPCGCGKTVTLPLEVWSRGFQSPLYGTTIRAPLNGARPIDAFRLGENETLLDALDYMGLVESADAMVRNRCETACVSGSDGNSLVDEVGGTDESLGEMLLTIFEPDAAVSWLRGPNSYLGGRPIDFLRAGRLDDVWDAVRAAEQTAWGG
jgi:hypothetical protein